MKVLFIGGTGIISSACTNEALARNVELYHLNRGETAGLRPPISGVKTLHADIRNQHQVEEVLQNQFFDVVVDWISFLPEHLENNLDLFKNKCRQYVFISSASAYQTPPLKLPITENTPLENPFWQYSRDKIACEKLITEKAPLLGIQYTIVRPSHTYDHTVVPIPGWYTAINRMFEGKPVIVPGDGTSIWTLTHNTDFARGFVGLLNNNLAYNQAFHITSDEWLTWDGIFKTVAAAFGVEPKLVHIPSDVIALYNQEIGDGLLGDKMHSMVFDNTKIKSIVPDFECKIAFEDGIKDSVAWFNTYPKAKVIRPELNVLFDKIIFDYSKYRKNIYP